MDKLRQSRAEQSRAEQSRAEQSRAEQSRAEQSRAEVYDVARAVVMVLVVIGHCSYYTIMTPYGGIDFSRAMLTAGVGDTYVHRAFSLLVNMIYTFHMPFFMALSGAVYALSRRRGKYQQATDFIGRKARRLLVPFLLVTLYAVAIKALSGYWQSSESVLYDIVVGQFFIQGNTHLWFLLTLFFEFVLFYALDRLGMLPRAGWRAVGFMLLLFSVQGLVLAAHPSVVLLQMVGKFALYFYLGYFFEQWRTRMDDWFTVRKIVCLLAFWMVVFFACRYGLSGQDFLQKSLHAVGSMMMAVSGCLACYGVILTWARQGWMKRRVVQILSRDSMGIYLYSDPWNYAILAAFFTLFGATGYGSELGALVLVALRFFLTMGLGYGSTECLRRFRI